MIPQLPLGGFQAQGQMDKVESNSVFILSNTHHLPQYYSTSYALAAECC